MTLLEFSSLLSQQDSSLTVYISRSPSWSPSSEIVLAREPDDGLVPTFLANRDMDYFLEVSIAKEVVSDWESEISHQILEPFSRSILLIYYALNDAYPTSDFLPRN